MGPIVTKAAGIARARLITQLSALVILNIPLIGLHTVCAPVFYCHSCPLSAFACPVGVLVNFSALRLIPFITIGILGIVGTLGGRIVCGWLCPFGLLQDALYRIRTRKIRLPYSLNYAKYALLIGLVFAVPFLLPGKPFTYCNFCPAGTLESSIPWAFMGINTGFGFSFWLRVGILAGVLALAVVASRSFCRTLCPLGAAFAVFNRFSLFRLKLTHQACGKCGMCSKKCLVGIDPVAQINTAECVRCLDCTTTDHLNLGIK
jgi:polyferredoxin